MPFKRKTARKGRHGIEKMRGKMRHKTPRFRLPVAPFFNHNGVKNACCPIFNQEKRVQNGSNPNKIRETAPAFLQWKKPGKPHGSGLFEQFCIGLSGLLSLGELRRATGCLEAVLAYSLAPVFLDFMGFLASALKCCPSI